MLRGNLRKRVDMMELALDANGAFKDLVFVVRYSSDYSINKLLIENSSKWGVRTNLGDNKVAIWPKAGLDGMMELSGLLDDECVLHWEIRPFQYVKNRYLTDKEVGVGPGGASGVPVTAWERVAARNIALAFRKIFGIRDTP